MFDLWGEAMPVPMPSLDLETADVSIKEKLTWEKELTGVYLSEHPFSSVARSLGSETTLCGQIDAELVGRTIDVIGIVASVRYLFTRDRKPFASAILEDLSGQVEVIVWPRVYADTTDLWQEGNILEVSGKVRLRDDRVQLNCEEVRHYQPTAQGEEAVASPPSEAPVTVEETSVSAAPAVNRRLIISLKQTADKDKDKLLLYKLKGTLDEFPGQDEVRLLITNGEKTTNLKLFNTSINYCPELRQRLVELVGKDGLKLESNA